MARDGSGNYSRVVTPPANGDVADADDFNAEINDIATALSDSINKAGTKAFAADQSMGGFKLTNLAAPASANDAARKAYVDSAITAAAQPLDATLTALAALSYTSGTLNVQMTGADTFALASDALNAKLAAANTFTSTLTQNYNYPAFYQRDSANGADAKLQALLTNDGTGRGAIRLLNDAYSSGANVIEWVRSSYTPTTVNFPNGTVQVGGVAARVAGKTAVPIPASAMVPNTTNGAAAGTTETTTNKVMYRTLDFDTTTQEGAQFSIPMPKGWNESTVTFQPLWTAASGSGGVVWELRAVALSDDDALDTAFGTGQTSTDTLITANDVHIGPESSAITIAGSPAEGDLVFFQIRRNVSDGSDTLGVDAKLIGIRLFITTNAANDA